MAQNLLENRFFVIDHIRRHQPVSRQGIAQHFGMNATTVGNLVRALIEEGLIQEQDKKKEPGAMGRPPIHLSIIPESRSFIGMDLYRGELLGVLGDFGGKARSKLALDCRELGTRDEITAGLVEMALSLKNEAKSAGLPTPAGVGIGLPGIVDTVSGTGVAFPRFRHWRNVPVAEIIRSATGLPTYVDHNANAFALGEAWFGAGQNVDQLISILFRTGLCVGIVRDRAVLAPSAMSSGELGHTVIKLQGRRCWCGARGCLETFISQEALHREVRKVVKRSPEWPGSNFMTQPESPTLLGGLVELADGGDQPAERILSDALEALAVGICNLIRIFSPPLLIFNGFLYPVAERLRELIAKRLTGYEKMPVATPEIVFSLDDRFTGARGAALLAANRQYSPIPAILNHSTPSPRSPLAGNKT